MILLTGRMILQDLWCSCYPTLIPLWDSKNVGQKPTSAADTWPLASVSAGWWNLVVPLVGLKAPHKLVDGLWFFTGNLMSTGSMFPGVLPPLSWPFQQQSSFTQQMCELMIHVSHVFQLCSQSHQDQIARRLSPHAVSFQSSSCRLPGELRKTHQ